MQEAAATVAEAGIDPWMSAAAVERQRWAAQFPHAADAGTTIGMVVAVLAALRDDEPGDDDSVDDAEEAPA